MSLLILYTKFLQKSVQTKVMKNVKFGSTLHPCNAYFCIQISENRPEYRDFGFHGVRSPTCENF